MDKKAKANGTLEKEEANKRTTLSLSLSLEDKKALKQIALDNDITVAALIHDWICQYEKESK